MKKNTVLIGCIDIVAVSMYYQWTIDHNLANLWGAIFLFSISGEIWLFRETDPDRIAVILTVIRIPIYVGLCMRDIIPAGWSWLFVGWAVFSCIKAIRAFRAMKVDQPSVTVVESTPRTTTD